MSKNTIKPLCVAIGLALAGSASALTMDFSGTNFYMKFLDGTQQGAPTGSIDTATGGDQGQFTEMNLIFKATVSPQVEAGGRIQSRSSAAYWTEFGGFGQENAGGGYTADQINHQKFMKLRGAYVELSPGYSWLSQVRVGTSDWGMFDPFTVGKIRYIDRDNYNGLYFKGPIAAGSTWELARVSLPSYLQFNWGQGPVCCSTDSTQYNEAVYIAQFKVPVAGWKFAVSHQTFNDHMLGAANSFTGQQKNVIYQNNVSALKAEGSPLDGLDLRGAFYLSKSNTGAGTFGETWGNAPRSSITARAYKLDVDWATPVDGLSFAFQRFDIGAGYYSATAARRESDVLLTEGTESAWYNWGSAIWAGGATADYTQSASNGMITDNAYMDFNESPAQSSVGWKGGTVVGKLDVASTPMSLEVTRVGYNNNWQNYSATGPLSNMYALNQDRTTDIAAFKINHIFEVLGGLDVNGKYKKVTDTDKVAAGAADDTETKDSGITLSVGNQLVSQLYGTLSYGQYNRDVSVGTTSGKNDKSIIGVRFAYNLSGFEVGVLSQWIKGKEDINRDGVQSKFYQYRMKAFAQVNF